MQKARETRAEKINRNRSRNNQEKSNLDEEDVDNFLEGESEGLKDEEDEEERNSGNRDFNPLN